MPNASAPLTYAQGVVAASGTSVALTAQPSDNTHTILVTNPSATIVGLIGQATAPAPLTAGLNAQRVAPGSTVTLGIGTISDRGAITAGLMAASNIPLYSGASGPSLAAAVAAGGWTRDAGPPATVRLNTATDQVAIGTATPVTGRKLTVLNTGTDLGVRIRTLASTDNVLDVVNGAEAFARFSVEATGRISFGSGLVAADAGIERGAADRVDTSTGDSFNVGTGGALLMGGTTVFDSTRNLAVNLVPSADNSISIGSSANRVSGFNGVVYRVFTTVSDAEPSLSVGTGGIAFGAGGASATDALIARSGIAALQITGSVSPQTTGFDLGTDTLRWDVYSREVWGGQVREVAFADSPIVPAAGDYEFHVDTSGGNVVFNLTGIAAVAANRKRRFNFLKVTTDANTVTINAAGGETIGTAASLVLAGGAVRANGITGPVTGLDWKVW